MRNILKKLNIKTETNIQQSTSVPNFSQFEEIQILAPRLPKKYKEKNFEKINIKTVISIGVIRKVSDKNFGKINIKFEMRIQQCTPVPNFSQLGELQFLRPDLPKKTLGWKIRTNST